MSICAPEVLLNMDNDFNNRISDLHELFQIIFVREHPPTQSNVHARVFFSVFSVTFVLHDPSDYSVLSHQSQKYL